MISSPPRIDSKTSQCDDSVIEAERFGRRILCPVVSAD